jgi:enoyl-CoA hydratase/carnithine racemase
MKSFTGKTLRWEWSEGVIELMLDHAPANEIGTAMLAELEKFVAAFGALVPETSVCIITSARKSVFSAGGDLRELYATSAAVPAKERPAGVRAFLERIHAVLNAIDAAPFVTIAAVHGACLGGGLELALACDMIIADKMARFAFPELRLGFIPGFGGIPRLKRDLGNAFVRDLLFTGRTVNATRAQAVGLVAQLAGEGRASPRDRPLLRTIYSSGRHGRLEKICRRLRPYALSALDSSRTTLPLAEIPGLNLANRRMYTPLFLLHLVHGGGKCQQNLLNYRMRWPR